MLYASMSDKAILTWDMLQKRGWQGLEFCSLYTKTLERKFLHCPFTKDIWRVVLMGQSSNNRTQQHRDTLER